jgi:hypothetical protein
MSRKNLKVSEIVHEELEVRKRRDESFDDVLKRELGIIPSTVDELTKYDPDHLYEAASHLVDSLYDEDRYDKIVIDHDDYFALNFDSQDSGRTIMQLRFIDESPWIDLFYRNNRGELENAGQILQQEGDDFVIADIEFTNPDNGARVDRTGSFDELERELREGLQALQDTAYERWG